MVINRLFGYISNYSYYSHFKVVKNEDTMSVSDMDI